MPLIEPNRITTLIVTDLWGNGITSRKLLEAEDPCDFDYRVEEEMAALMKAYPSYYVDVIEN